MPGWGLGLPKPRPTEPALNPQRQNCLPNHPSNNQLPSKSPNFQNIPKPPQRQEMDPTYHFSCQFLADVVAMNHADFIITSTYQEIAGGVLFCFFGFWVWGLGLWVRFC